MIRKLKKKAFTLIELLVVIAILAVLATVGIIGYGAFTKKAKESNDIYLVKQMNIVLEASEVLDGKNKTMTDALDDVFDKGYDLTKLTPTSEKYNIVWDSVNDRMVLLNDQREIVFPKEKMSANKDLYVIVSTKDEIKNTYKDYSFYLRDNFNNNQEISLSISNGIDVGNNENITSISYANETKHTVAIRTNGGTLNINASQDTVNHFGWVKKLNVQSVATNDCYHEYGFVGELKTFASGKFVAYDGCEFHQTKEAVESVIGSNAKDLTKAKFGQHYYKNGKCIVEGCTVVDHEHVYVEESRTEATCTGDGSVQEKCTICGATKTEIIKKLNHEWTNYTIDDSKHSHTCTKCNTIEEGEHNTNGENGKCSICGYLGVKNGLVDGYYYKNNELYTGNEGNYEFKNGVLVIKDSYDEENNKHNFIISNDIPYDYLTDKLFIDTGDVFSYKYSFSIIDETKKYSVDSAFIKEPLYDLKNKQGWGKNEYDILMGKNQVTQMIGSDDFTSYMKVIGYDSLSTDNINSYIEKYNNESLKIKYSEFLKLKYLREMTIVSIDDQLCNVSVAGVYQNNNNSYFNLGSGTLDDPKILFTTDGEGRMMIQVSINLYDEIETAYTSIYFDENGKYKNDKGFSMGCNYDEANNEVKVIYENNVITKFKINVSDNIYKVIVNDNEEVQYIENKTTITQSLNNVLSGLEKLSLRDIDYQKVNSDFNLSSTNLRFKEIDPEVIEFIYDTYYIKFCAVIYSSNHNVEFNCDIKNLLNNNLDNNALIDDAIKLVTTDNNWFGEYIYSNPFQDVEFPGPSIEIFLTV